MSAGGGWSVRWRWAIRLATAIAVGVAAIAVLPSTSGTANPVVPTQYIAKQYSELLGRTPTDREWSEWVDSFDARTCTANALADMGRNIARSHGFAATYPDDSTLDRAQRFTALTRAALSRDPNGDDWNAFFVPYRDGGTWLALVEAVYASSDFEHDVVSAACNPLDPNYGFGTTRAAGEPLDLRDGAGLGASRTQVDVQRELDQVAASGGGTVALAPGEVIRVGGTETGNRQLVVPSGVILTTDTAPSRQQYARMGRVVPDGPDAKVCVDTVCNDVAMVRVEAGGALTNVWVEGDGPDADQFKIAGVESSGSTDALPTKIVGNRVSAPARDGVGIRARGFSLSGEPCTGEVIADNLVTGYGSEQRFDARGQARWADGIAVGCESTQVNGNDLVDITDAAIVVYGSYNRALEQMRSQTSTVTANRVLSAGLSGHVALGFDAIGECSTEPSGGVVPCLDEVAPRDFQGATISNNTYWTGPRTHFDVGLMIGGGVRWGDHRIFGAGAAATDNTTAPNGARVNIGVVVLAMNDAVLANNTGLVKLVDGNPLARWGRCPQMNLAVGALELATTSVTPAQVPGPGDAADGCLLGEPSPHGLDPLEIDPSGDFLVFASTGTRFTPWGLRTPGVPPETFWNADFDRLVEAFREVRRMGSNLVRFNLQFAEFVGPPTPGNPDGTINASNLARLRDSVDLAEQTGLYIELSGLRIEADSDNGDWYAQRTAAARWKSQALFWKSIAAELASSNALAWYDVMNEPSASAVTKTTWCAGALAGRCYVQFLTKERDGRTSVEIARDWMAAMRNAIRDVDSRHLVSVGALPYGNGAFRPADLGELEDLAAVHLYPASGDAELARALAEAEASKPEGQPLILDETGGYGGNVSAFILGSSTSAAGWVGHYFERTPAEILSSPSALGDYVSLDFYRTFMRLSAAVNAYDDGVMQP